MAAASRAPPPQPQPQTTAPATITITNNVPNPGYNQFTITFETNTIITTTITSDPTMISAWITTLFSTLSPPSLFGIDVEWRPNFTPNSNNPVATLQLCTLLPNFDLHGNTIQTHSCLIVQLLHCSQPLPRQLTELLANEGMTFVGVGVNADAKKLFDDYGLRVDKKFELGKLAKQRNVDGLRPGVAAGLKELTRVLMGVLVEKPKKVTMSRWDQRWLTDPQIQYACIDAFLSFEIGARLLALPASPVVRNGLIASHR